MYDRCLSQRWLIMDEISTGALYILGIMEKHVSKARDGKSFSRDLQDNLRSWGGLNLVCGGDWSQLPPVLAKSIFRNPFKVDYEAPERRILNMFWKLQGSDAIPSQTRFLFELKKQVRSRDRWLNHVLASNREGQETWEIYCFSHGLPTRHVGSWHQMTIPLHVTTHFVSIFKTKDGRIY